MVEQRRKTATLNIRVEPSLKEAAEKAAADDHRSLTSLIEKLLTDHLRERGYLRRPSEQGIRPQDLTSENDG
jgi:hypothetical protein